MIPPPPSSLPPCAAARQDAAPPRCRPHPSRFPVRFPGGCGFQPRPFPFTSAPAGHTTTCHLSLFTFHSRRRRGAVVLDLFPKCVKLPPF